MFPYLPLQFSRTTPFDRFLIIIAACSASIHGGIHPAFALFFGSFIDLFIDNARTQLISAQIAAAIFDKTNITIPDVDCDNPDPFEHSDIMTVMGFPINLTLQFGHGSTEPIALVISSMSNYSSIFNSISENKIVLECLDSEAFIQGVNTFVYGFLGVAVTIFIASYLEVSMFQIACERQVKKIRLTFYRAIMRQEVGWFDANPSGELASRMAV